MQATTLLLESVERALGMQSKQSTREEEDSRLLRAAPGPFLQHNGTRHEDISTTVLSVDERRVLAQKLDRWRYQHLGGHARSLSPRDEQLVDALDDWINQLSGFAPRMPRATRHAIRDHPVETDSIVAAIATLDSGGVAEDLIPKARELTRRNFSVRGASEKAETTVPRMLLYAPLYVSSDCVNYCTYCGFRYPEDIVRKHLTLEEISEQTRILRALGLRRLLVVAGDFPSRTTMDYFKQIIDLLVKNDVEPSIEIAPQSSASYSELVVAGACGLTLYQETYDEDLYAKYHIRGPKSAFHWRLEGHERAAEVGMRRLGLGILLGLADPRRDVRALMRHGAYLAERFPHCTLAFSLPRVHDAPEGFRIPHPVSDDELVLFYCLLRIAFPRAELVLSTRESASLRDRLAKMCITQMSAGSCTSPGGYKPAAEAAGEQFPIADDRSPGEVADWLRGEGFVVL